MMSLQRAADTRVFDVAGVTYAYPGSARPAVEAATLTVDAGTLLAIIGPNGSGKSTLVRLMLGALRPVSGSIRHAGRDVMAWNRRELARAIGVVGQRDEMLYPILVRELVAMGRYPHLGPWRREGRDDLAAVAQAMQRCAVEELADRPADQLSAGELQRTRIARALAQQPATLVLDEPTAQLDIAHEMSIFELLADFCRSDGATVVVVTHNLNLAARYASMLLLMERGRVVAHGPPADVIEREIVERVYGWPVRIVPHPGPGADAGAPQIVPLTGTRSDRPPA
jgi:cobalamin transport system ATP-binding protein